MILVPETVVINQNLDVADPAGTVAGEARSEADWKATNSAEAWAFYQGFVAWTEASLGEVRVDYSPKSYIGIRRGRRVWAPLWPRKDGAFIYLPDPDGLHGEQQSPSDAGGGTVVGTPRPGRSGGRCPAASRPRGTAATSSAMP